MGFFSPQVRRSEGASRLLKGFPAFYFRDARWPLLELNFRYRRTVVRDPATPKGAVSKMNWRIMATTRGFNPHTGI